MYFFLKLVRISVRAALCSERMLNIPENICDFLFPFSRDKFYAVNEKKNLIALKDAHGSYQGANRVRHIHFPTLHSGLSDDVIKVTNVLNALNRGCRCVSFNMVDKIFWF